jgi:hypothetical protein
MGKVAIVIGYILILYLLSKSGLGIQLSPDTGGGPA